MQVCMLPGPQNEAVLKKHQLLQSQLRWLLRQYHTGLQSQHKVRR